MPALLDILQEAGGADASREHSARLRRLLLDELERSHEDLRRTRSGYASPVIVGFAGGEGALLAVCPVPAQLRADAAVTTERGWLVAAGAVGAMVRALDLPRPAAAGDLAMLAGRFEGRLALHLPVRGGEGGEAAQLAALAFDEDMTGVDRLRSRAAALPAHVVEPIADLRTPIGRTHPLAVAEAVARLGGLPADEASLDEHEEEVLALLAPPVAATRAHDDPDPVRRIARRILQRLDGMGKWGGYHTEFVHLSRGFPARRRALASEIGERLLAAGLLVEKISVGQRHVYLNPRRSGDIRRLIESGRAPHDLTFPDDHAG